MPRRTQRVRALCSQLSIVATLGALAVAGCSSCSGAGGDGPGAPAGDDAGAASDGGRDDTTASPDDVLAPPDAPLDARSDASDAPDATVTKGHLFGSHTTGYAKGTIFPSAPAAELDLGTTAFYDAWKAKYLVAGCGAGRYYVDVSADGVAGGGKGAGSITVSEAHGYGMLITALIAGHDPDARKLFDGMYAFFRDHPSVNSADLMAWNQVAGCKNDPSGGNDAATDGDLDVAYALLLADAQWGSAGAIDYAAQAKKVIAAIAAHEMSAATNLALLGDWVDATSTKYYGGTRPSDFMIDHFRAYGAATGDARWSKIVDAHWKLVDAIQTGFAAGTGLLPDFVVDTGSAPKPASGTYLEGSHDGDYDYNACRVPWRLGTDYLLSGDPRALVALQRMNAWIRKKTGNDPLQIDAGYTLAGDNTSGSLDNNLAFVAPFGVAAMAEGKNQAWLDAIWATTLRRTIADDAYYGNTIKMLAMLVMSGNYFRP